MLEGLRGEDSIAELCRREGIAQNLYYRWSKDSWRLARSAWLAIRLGRHLGRGQRSASRGHGLKEVVADLTLENRVLKKSVTGDGEDGE